jgi:hypothetical protein
MEAKTVERMAVIEAYRDRVAQNADRLFNYQMTLARGVSYLYRMDKDKDGSEKAVLIEEQDEIVAYLDGNTDGKYYFISTDKPDNRAIDSMLDRAFGKAPQKLEHTGEDGAPIAFIDMAKSDDTDS